MEEDWRKLSGITRLPASKEIGIANELGAVSLTPVMGKLFESESQIEYNVNQAIGQENRDLVYDIGQYLINQAKCSSYIELPVIFRNEAEYFLVRIDDILGAYKKNGKYLKYCEVVKFVAGYSFVPHLMIKAELLVRREDIPKNEVPPNFEYCLAKWIRERLPTPKPQSQQHP